MAKDRLSAFAIWRSLFSRTTVQSEDGIEAAERGEAVALEGEKTPLLSHSKSTTGDAHSFSNLSILQMMNATVLAPVYAVLVFLPMLPFWTFAAFLVYLLGTASNDNFYLYFACLTVLLPFNMVGTIAIVRKVWTDMYGE